MNAGRWWPIAMVALLALTVASNVALLVAANGPGAGVLERDYYRKGIAHDSTLAQRAHNRTLGWTAGARLVPVAGGARVEVALADRDGTPIADARVAVEAIHNRAAAHPVVDALPAAGDGTYAATLPLAHRGRWELRVSAVRGADRYTVSLRRDLP